MNAWCFLLLAAVVQFSSAQALRGMPNRPLNYANNARGTPNGIAMGRSLPNGMPLGQNQFASNMPKAAKNMANTNFDNFANYNLANTNRANTNPVHNMPGFNSANNIANGVETNLGNQVLANDIAGAAIASKNMANTNFIASAGKPATNFAESIYNPYIENGNGASKITYTAMANGKPNGATFSFGNNGIPITVIGGLPTNLPVGIEILADNLQVGGTVSVMGRMPISGAVAINGNVPNEGSASVNYSCGSPNGV